MSLNPWAIVTVTAVFVGVLWFIIRDDKSNKPQFSQNKEDYTLNINIALDAKPLISSLIRDLGREDSLFREFDFGNIFQEFGFRKDRTKPEKNPDDNARG